MLSGPQIKPQSGKVEKIVIFLHGVGSDGENLISLADFFADILPNAVFVAPNGIEDFTLGGSGYQWFQLYDNYGQRLHISQLVFGVEQAAKTVAKYITELAKQNNLTHKDVYLIGFSQGSMVSIQTALTMEHEIGGVVAFSGGLLKRDIEASEVKSKPAICLIHGEQDEVVPVSASIATVEILNKLGVKNELHKINRLGHSIDITGINLAKDFLKNL